MGTGLFEAIVNILKMGIIFLLMVSAVPILVWLERRGSAFIQNRYGPNRVGPLGLMQLSADAIKFLFKESFLPRKSVALLYYIAPVIAMVPAALAFASIPLGPAIHIGTHTFLMQSFELNVGIVFVLGVSSLSAYALLMAGYGSSNKYSLMGSLRASAQMISYELALSLSLVGMILIYGTFSFSDMVQAQAGPLTFLWFGQQQTFDFLPNWGFFYNPLGMILFATATFAESNRLPFDLPESEGELVAGFHTEYGGFNLLLFYIGEYGHMMVASALLATFYFGGYALPGVSVEQVHQFWLSHVSAHASGESVASLLTGFTHFFVMLLKIAVFLWIFIWVRWTLPRFRYDQLMDLGWKTMLPWALANTAVTAVWIFLMHGWGIINVRFG
jgi:NADH-quinone oxidoreductase subunit H